MRLRNGSVSTLLGSIVAGSLLFSSLGWAAKPAPPSPGVYENSTSHPLFDLIESAQRSLDIAIYEIGDPDVLASVKRAMDRGVRVRVLKEPRPVGERCKVFDDASQDDDDACAAQKKFRDQVRAQGGVYVPFQKAELCPIPSASCVLHGKMVIADGRTALVSTGNFNSTNLCNAKYKPSHCERDFSVISNDAESVSVLGAIFEKDVQEKAYDLDAVFPASTRSRLTVSPLSQQPLVDFILSARKSLRIENQYFKDPKLNEALKAAARRGVKVELTLASECAFGKPTANEADKAKKLYSDFEAAGISVRMFTASISVGGHAGYLHAKVMVADDDRAWVGSVNGSVSATSNNREYGVFLDDLNDVSSLSETLSSDHRDEGAETWQESLRCLKDHRFAGVADAGGGAPALLAR